MINVAVRQTVIFAIEIKKIFLLSIIIIIEQSKIIKL